MLFVCSAVWAQSLTEQIGLIKQVLPETTQIAVLFQKDHAPSQDELNKAAAMNGVRIYVVPSASMRDLAAAMEGALKTNPNFVMFWQPDDLGGKNALKYAAKSSMSKKVPLFSDHPDTLNAGGLGALVEEGNKTSLQLNGSLAKQMGIAIAESSSPQINVSE
ncbi:MAG: hypothetical protein H6510_05345 [Acidobacteria bacterium]|nr:hypothetical protein [Acidobacteriota bacterium]